jgi:SAM-dependent methyltransferase
MSQQALIPKRVVRRNEIEVLSLAESFFESSILFALLKLKVFERIGEGTKTLNELAVAMDARPETLVRLLNAGVCLQLLESQDGLNFSLAPVCRAVLLPSADEHYLGNWIRNMDYFRAALSKVDEAILKSGPTIDPSTHLGGDEESTQEFVLAMHNYALLHGEELAHFLDTTVCKSLLDLGCGPGTYAFHLGMHNPGLKLYLLDRPEVLEFAAGIQTRYPLKNEIHYLPLDAMKDRIPGSYDMILVSNMLHMLGEEENRTLINRLHRSVNQGGSLVIQARYLQDDRLGGRSAIFLDLLQLCITPNGRNHSVAETRRWLEEAGFINIEYCSMTLFNPNSFLRGYRP